MKQTNFLTKLFLLCALIVGSTSVWADEEVITLNDQGYSNEQKVTSTTSGDVTLTYDKGTGSTDPTYYNTGNGVRVYAGGKMAITASGNEITAVSITYAKNNSPTLSFTVNDGGSTTSSSIEDSPGTWAGSATTVYFNVATKGHARIQAVTVTYTGAIKHTLSSAVSPANAGTVTIGESSVAEGKTTTITAEPASGYTFTSWSVTGTGSSVTDESAASTTFKMGTENATVTANFAEVNYWTITYDYNDGVTSNEEVHVLKAEAASYTLKSAPTREDYTFIGWKIGETTYAAGVAYVPSGNVTVTAQWEFDGTLITYNKSNKSDLATGAKYIMGASYTSSGTTTWKYCQAMGSDTYLHADVVKAHGSLDADKAVFFDETPEVITLNEIADGWEMISENGKIGLKGDKQLGYDTGDVTWNLAGTDAVPVFSAVNSSKTYIMKFNWNSGKSRFNAYQSGQQDVYFYRLEDGKDIYTLTLDFNDGASADEDHRVLETATYTLITPTRSGYVFMGWNTEEDGTGTSYEAGAYTMPAAATKLYAQWTNTETVTKLADRTYGTYVTKNALDFTDADVEAYIAKGITGEGDAATLEIEKVTTVKAGTPIIVKSDDKSVTSANVKIITDAEAANNGDNKLVAGDGTDVTTDVAYTYYYIASDKFHKATTGSLVVGKAYLKLETASAKAFTIAIGGDGETTGINTLDSRLSTLDKAQSMYNLAGQKVSNSYKGIVIINGKKVIK